MLFIVKILQFAGFILTVIGNIALLYLLETKAPRMFGSYKYLMITFCVYSLVYGIIEIFTQPLYCSTTVGFLIFVDSFIKFEKSISTNVIIIYSSLYGFCITLLTFHFIFRYVAVCRPNCLHFFGGKRIVLAIIPPFLMCLAWFTLIKCVASPTAEKIEHFRQSLRDNYDEDSSRLGFMAILYYEDQNGRSERVLNQFVSVTSVSSVMFSLVLTIIFCAIKTCLKVGHQSTTISQRTRDLNKQLFQTLMLQFLIPFVTMFVPVAAMLILPMFKIDIGLMGNICGVTAGIYPALDALVPMVMIKDFRTSFVGCSKKVDWRTSSTIIETTATH